MKQGKGKNKARQRILPRECTDHSRHTLPTTQEKILHGHYQMVCTEIRLIIFFAAKDGNVQYSQMKKKKKERERSRIDRGSDHQLLIAKFKLKLKKVGKNTRPFRYDLNQNLIRL